MRRVMVRKGFWTTSRLLAFPYQEIRCKSLEAHDLSSLSHALSFTLDLDLARALALALSPSLCAQLQLATVGCEPTVATHGGGTGWVSAPAVPRPWVDWVRRGGMEGLHSAW